MSAPSGAAAGSTSSGAAGDVVLDPEITARLKRDSQGLVAAVVQEATSREVLMLAWMDEEALRRTLTEGRAVYWSRSRGEHWRKGDTSGHRQWVRSVRLDCDGDALVLEVDQEGPACHRGTPTCFDGGQLPVRTIPVEER